MSRPERWKPVILAARWTGWALALVMVGAVLLAAQRTGQWFAGREADVRVKTEIHEARVSDCVWKPPSGLTWAQCEERVSRAEEATQPAP